VLLKTILRLAQPFLRNRDGIIDAFLQHFRGVFSITLRFSPRSVRRTQKFLVSPTETIVRLGELSGIAVGPTATLLPCTRFPM
jgi:hypothetical protein